MRKMDFYMADRSNIPYVSISTASYYPRYLCNPTSQNPTPQCSLIIRLSTRPKRVPNALPRENVEVLLTHRPWRRQRTIHEVVLHSLDGTLTRDIKHAMLLSPSDNSILTKKGRDHRLKIRKELTPCPLCCNITLPSKFALALTALFNGVRKPYGLPIIRAGFLVFALKSPSYRPLALNRHCEHVI